MPHTKCTCKSGSVVDRHLVAPGGPGSQIRRWLSGARFYVLRPQMMPRPQDAQILRITEKSVKNFHHTVSDLPCDNSTHPRIPRYINGFRNRSQLWHETC